LKDIMLKGKSMGKENLFGAMVVNMKEIFRTTILKDMEHTYGGMEDSIQGIGKIIKWKEKEFLPG